MVKDSSLKEPLSEVRKKLQITKILNKEIYAFFVWAFLLFICIILFFNRYWIIERILINFALRNIAEHVLFFFVFMVGCYLFILSMFAFTYNSIIEKDKRKAFLISLLYCLILSLFFELKMNPPIQLIDILYDGIGILLGSIYLTYFGKITFGIWGDKTL